MADPDHDPAFVVVDRAKLGLKTIELPGDAAIDELRARNAGALVYIVHDVEDLIFVIDIYYRTPGKYLPHALHEDVPLLGAMEIVGHKEAAAQQIIAHLVGFFLI